MCKYIRTKSNVPIIFLTAFDEEVNVVLGLDIGEDDYITKPFRVRELISRIKALLRRNSQNISKTICLLSGDIWLNTLSTEVKKKDKNIVLTSNEYKLLLIFMDNPHKVMDRDTLLSELIGSEKAFFDENTLSVYIKRLRDKIENNSKTTKYIITKREMGYMGDRDVIEK